MTIEKIERIMAIITVAMTLLSVIGAALPESSKLGQFIRRIAADLRNLNLKAKPPEDKKP